MLSRRAQVVNCLACGKVYDCRVTLTSDITAFVGEAFDARCTLHLRFLTAPAVAVAQPARRFASCVKGFAALRRAQNSEG
jgi:hypothetical protein